ncbi:MAG: hypothetical protein PHH13_01085 [Candidatus Peribacteraceae bacterium]|nr:hypothetical protein [Candidatus Peribacteraceae bacterium]
MGRFIGRIRERLAERRNAGSSAQEETDQVVLSTEEQLQKLKEQSKPGPETPKQPLNVRMLPLNEGWHQYDIPDIGQTVKLRYPSENGDAELRLDTNESLRMAGNTLQMQRLDGRIVISAHKELAGVTLTVGADGFTEQSIAVPEAKETSESTESAQHELRETEEKKEEQQPGVLFVDKVGDREFLLPKENAQLFIRYDQADNQGSMVGWYDMQPDVLRSEHEYFVVDGRNQPFLHLSVQPKFTGDIQLWRNNRQEVIHVGPKDAGVDQSPEHTLERTKGLLEWLENQSSDEDVIRCEQAHGYERDQHGGRPLNTVLSEALEQKDAVQAVEKILQGKEDKLKKLTSTTGASEGKEIN